MNKINLNNLELKTFTEQNALDYCRINNININAVKELYLSVNELTDISGIKLFKNLEYLWLNDNLIKDISVLKDLIKLEVLYISNNEINDISVIQNLNNLKYLSLNGLELESDQIKYINSLKNLKTLYSFKGFKNRSVLKKQINKNINIIG